MGRARGQSAVTLVEARTKAGELHRLVRAGVDPLADRDAAAAVIRATAQQSVIAARTFRQAASEFLASKGTEWSNSKHAKQWPNTLRDYVFPHFGDMPIADITTTHVLAALTPIWTAKTETASRVRARIEAILNAEKVRGTRKGDNPASWKGHLALLLPAPSKISPVENHPALPYADAPAFFSVLQVENGVGARALEFTILTAARSAMMFLATWGEIDFISATWSVPAGHMKGRKPFRVPLSQEALAVLRRMEPLRETSGPECFVFPGESGGHMSEGTMTAVLKRMSLNNASVHGFRSTCRDWISECTDFWNEVAEKTLAHAVGTKLKAAYRRGELFQKRQEAMASWGAYCGSTR